MMISLNHNRCYLLDEYYNNLRCSGVNISLFLSMGGVYKNNNNNNNHNNHYKMLIFQQRRRKNIFDYSVSKASFNKYANIGYRQRRMIERDNHNYIASTQKKRQQQQAQKDSVFVSSSSLTKKHQQQQKQGRSSSMNMITTSANRHNSNEKATFYYKNNYNERKSKRNSLYSTSLIRHAASRRHSMPIKNNTQRAAASFSPPGVEDCGISKLSIPRCRLNNDGKNSAKHFFLSDSIKRSSPQPIRRFGTSKKSKRSRRKSSECNNSNNDGPCMMMSSNNNDYSKRRNSIGDIPTVLSRRNSNNRSRMNSIGPVPSVLSRRNANNGCIKNATSTMWRRNGTGTGTTAIDIDIPRDTIIGNNNSTNDEEVAMIIQEEKKEVWWSRTTEIWSMLKPISRPLPHPKYRLSRTLGFKSKITKSNSNDNGDNMLSSSRFDNNIKKEIKKFNNQFHNTKKHSSSNNNDRSGLYSLSENLSSQSSKSKTLDKPSLSQTPNIACSGLNIINYANRVAHAA